MGCPGVRRNNVGGNAYEVDADPRNMSAAISLLPSLSWRALDRDSTTGRVNSGRVAQPVWSQFRSEATGWQQKAAERLADLYCLPVGWDGFDGRPVDSSTAAFALVALSEIMTEETPMPSLMPLSYGGVQIEWHRRGWDIEIEVVRPNKMVLWAHDIERDNECHVDLENDLTIVHQFMDRIRG